MVDTSQGMRGRRLKDSFSRCATCSGRRYWPGTKPSPRASRLGSIPSPALGGGGGVSLSPFTRYGLRLAPSMGGYSSAMVFPIDSLLSRTPFCPRPSSLAALSDFLSFLWGISGTSLSSSSFRGEALQEGTPGVRQHPHGPLCGETCVRNESWSKKTKRKDEIKEQERTGYERMKE
ncbi:hypothetical protein E2C01_002759 [Portunus trituberculatus]|uniref:Uncharacterized protein n=1 Tax=Portunus trituberculatus TaxID=210409 RepID=A0A5B7CL52_PORTR|nr:hypothetical protein [Portunus trituberculatus]